MFEKLLNPKVGLYLEGEKAYMSIDAILICSIGSKFNGKQEVKVTIPKIEISKAVLNISNKAIEGLYTQQYRECSIEFPVIPIKSEYVRFQVDEPEIKEMTKEEIEQKLGYKFKII